MNPHPLCDLFPPMSKAEFAELSEDIARNGQVDPIITHKGMIIDGRHRYNACCFLGKTPVCEEWDGQGGSLLGFVISRNLHRRHLDASARAVLGVKLLPHLEAEADKRRRELCSEARRRRTKGNSKADGEVVTRISQPLSETTRNPPARDEAAKLVDVAPSYISDVKRIRETAPEVFERLESGEINIPQAKREIAKVESEPAPEPQTHEETIAQSVFRRFIRDADIDDARELMGLLSEFIKQQAA